nr:LuxR family transcriptional regulator [Mycobacterium decipiens]
MYVEPVSGGWWPLAVTDVWLTSLKGVGLGMSALVEAVTLLTADVQDSTGRSQARQEELAANGSNLDRTVSDAIATHGGVVRPVDQDLGSGLVAAFLRAGDAIACALDLQLTALAPKRPRVGVHTGDVRLRDDGTIVGAAIDESARLRDLAHEGQTLLSAVTSDLVSDQLPADAWLIDIGSYPLRVLHRQERVLQLCHPDLPYGFPPLRPSVVTRSNLPVQFTTFVGRDAQIREVQELLAKYRLVTLRGDGGVGKTRLAIQIAAASEFRDGLCFVDLAPIADPDIVSTTAAHALGLIDQPGRSIFDTLTHAIGNRHMLMVLDNCEHLLDACAELVVALLGACPELTILATSRESIGVTGEVTWLVPSLCLANEAIQLFTERARLVQPNFEIAADNTEAVSEICRRLDGMPLAIELAAARLRSLAPSEIANSLDDRFRLLTGGARSAVQRQQTLQASMDWSYALLTEAERILFRRLAVFVGGFGLTAACEVAAASSDDFVERYPVLDQLALLVGKSLVVAEESRGRTRYRLLETVRQYALEKLSESDEVDEVRARHLAHYTTMAAGLNPPASTGYEQRLLQAETEIDNLRAAFTWSRGNGDITAALQLASALQPLWSQERMHEGLAWLDSILDGEDNSHLGVPARVWARALAEKVILNAWLAMRPMVAPDIVAHAQHALALARDADDSTVLVRALVACGCCSCDAEAAEPYFAEAMEVARAIEDEWTLSQIGYWQMVGIFIYGEPIPLRAAIEQARELAEDIGNRFVSRQCRLFLCFAQMWEGDPNAALALSREISAEAEEANDVVTKVLGLYVEAMALSYRGDCAANAIADAALEAATELGGVYQCMGYGAITRAALATGDTAAVDASEASWDFCNQQNVVTTHRELMAQAALARGDVPTARRFADEAVLASTGWHQMVALIARARVAIAQDDLGRARDDAHAAVACGVDAQTYLAMPDAIELLAGLASDAGSHRQAARLFGAAAGQRQRTGETRHKIWDADYEAAMAALHDAMGEADFDAAWAEGSAAPFDEAIAYAQRGRGERKRPSNGWDALTPAEHKIVQLVTEGLATKEISARLFVSPRTVQTHLTHIYAKLDLTSRVQLVQAAAQHSNYPTDH